MAKFQCNASKTILEVFADHDINGMRCNPSYTELLEVQQEVIKVVPPVKRINNKSNAKEE
jgi:hypothetical protein